ncbi:MAG: alkaline phosphatase family protein [Acidobacteriota bacterium]
MRRRLFLMAALAAPLFSQAQAPRPKLVLAIVVDQFRYDYLTRFRPEFTGGLKQLMNQGAVFTNANYEAAPTVTAVGHSTFMTGAPPSVSGIAGNTWWERTENKNVQSVSDDAATILGGTGTGASPRRLLVSTVGDELKLSGVGGKAIGVSLKDRSAILPVGRMADAAYWFDGRAGGFVSSTYYFTALPAWVAEFDATHPADKYAGTQWLTTTLPAQAGPPLYAAVDATPFGDRLVLDFALKTLAAEKLGTGAKTDLLAVSFSAIDYVGHASGPDTPAMRDMVLQVDRAIGELLAAAEKQAGAGNVLAVFTADHGVSPIPEENIAKKLPGGRFNAQQERAAVELALKAQFGDGTYVSATGELGLYLNLELVASKKLDRRDVERVAAEALRKQPHVFRVYTRTQIQDGNGGDLIDRRIRNGFNAARSGDLVIVHEPYYLSGASGTNHGSPFSYDTHVPMIFWGPAGLVKKGVYSADAAVTDLAPTLATMLRVATPSGSMGRVLDEILP